MKTLYVTKGLPASGKTTWAKEFQAEHPTTVLVSKDDLRAMLHQGKHTKGNERQVVDLRDVIVKDAIKRNRDVIVHDTNLNPIHIEALQMIASEAGSAFVIQDFTDVPLDTCLARDAVRPHPVGAKVIRGMWKQYLHVPAVRSYDPSLPDAIICDLDGTLAIMCDRSPYDTTGLCENDSLNRTVARILRSEAEEGTEIILMSGREEIVADATERWLQKHNVPWNALYMRPTGDSRKDSIVKREMFEGFVEGECNVLFVIDDRPQVVRMWREELGLFVFDVNQSGDDF